MSDRLADLGPTTDVALITFSQGAREAQQAHPRAADLAFPILVDPDRATYRAYGLGRGSVARVWGWRALLRYGQIVRAEGLGRLRRPTEDTLQLGGDFVIAPDGTLTWGFWGAGPDDRPPVADLIAAVGSAS